MRRQIKWNIEKYLTRFHASYDQIPSLQQLTTLQKLHMFEIPFENLDVIRREPIYLNLNSIYEKIVLRKRGGYCYELNGLFHWLLEKLGYDASLIAATVCRPNGQWAKPETHAAILVQLNEPYLVDVGFGDSTILPIPLNGDSRTDVSGTYHGTAVRQWLIRFDPYPEWRVPSIVSVFYRSQKNSPISTKAVYSIKSHPTRRSHMLTLSQKRQHQVELRYRIES